MSRLVLYMNKYRDHPASTSRHLLSKANARWERSLTSTSSYNPKNEGPVTNLMRATVGAGVRLRRRSKSSYCLDRGADARVVQVTSERCQKPVFSRSRPTRDPNVEHCIRS